MWYAITFLVGGIPAFVFGLLWRGERKDRRAADKESEALRLACEQYQAEIESLETQIRDVIARTDRAMREKRRAAQKCAADFDSLALAGQNDPAVVAAVARSIEQLFEVSEAETTIGGD